MHEDWRGNLNDDCWLERYGMTAHAECLDKNMWWFAIAEPPIEGSGKMYRELYNASDATTPVRLTTGKMARAAAESCMEMLKLQRQGYYPCD